MISISVLAVGLLHLPIVANATVAPNPFSIDLYRGDVNQTSLTALFNKFTSSRDLVSPILNAGPQYYYQIKASNFSANISTLANIDSAISKAKSMNMSYLSYDLEPGAGAEFTDYVNSTATVANKVHSAGLKLILVPRWLELQSYGKQIAPYADLITMQLRYPLSSLPGGYVNWVSQFSTLLRNSAGHPILIGEQLLTIPSTLKRVNNYDPKDIAEGYNNTQQYVDYFQLYYFNQTYTDNTNTTTTKDVIPYLSKFYQYISLTGNTLPKSSSIVITSSSNHSIFGNLVTFTAAVSPSTATGTVTFTIDGTAATPAAVFSGQATFSISTLAAGSHTISAQYSGDANFAASSSSALTQTVNKAGTTTTLTSSLNPSVNSQQITFAATVVPVSPGTGTPAGTVTFTIDGVARPAITLASGHAAISLSTLSVGPHTITVVYSGDSNFVPSSGPTMTQTVNVANTTTTVASSANPSISGQWITFAATVVPVSPGTGTPAGTVTFTIDGVARPAITLASGHAAISLPTLSIGTHYILAKYSGNTNFAKSSSNTLTQTVQ